MPNYFDVIRCIICGERFIPSDLPICFKCQLKAQSEKKEKGNKMRNERALFFAIGFVIGLFVGISGVIGDSTVANYPNKILVAEIE